MSSNLHSAYRYWRNKGKTASVAIDSARKDVSGGTERYPESAIKSGYSSGKPFEAYGHRQMRWIESPSAAGLRFVGYCDELDRSIGHNGWYLDDDGCETVRGVVFQMAGRNKRPIFIAGYEDPFNGRADCDGPVCLAFDELFEGDAPEWDARYGYWQYHDDAANHEAAQEAARRADGIAESYAEVERDYQRASTAEWLASEPA